MTGLFCGGLAARRDRMLFAFGVACAVNLIVLEPDKMLLRLYGAREVSANAPKPMRWCATRRPRRPADAARLHDRERAANAFATGRNPGTPRSR
jgi:hypothetical protein